MGYEMGFAKTKDNYNDVYWNWCGWEYTELHNNIALICGNRSPEFGEDCVIPVKELAFIDDLYEQVIASIEYRTYSKLLLIDDLFADEFLNSISVWEKAKFISRFVLPNEYQKYQPIATILYQTTINGYLIVDSLKEAYDKMIADGVTEVVLYGG